MSHRILLIEDDPISQDIIRSLLAGQGHQVDVAADGFSALERARAIRYDVALIDYHLPEMDGYALGRLLCEQRPAEGPAPVLIGLTADRNGLAARRGADAVFKAILPKPIRPGELFEAIARLCAAPAAMAAPAAVDSATPAPVGPDAARRATAALWRGHGLTRHPKAFVCPPPAAEQVQALGLCFELVEPGEAELVILLERHGINEAVRVSRRDGAPKRPVVGLSGDHADICDALFEVDNAASWRALALLVTGAPEADTVLAVAAPALVALPPPERPAAERPAAMAPAPIEAAAVAVAPAMPAALPPGGLDLRQIVLQGIATPLCGLRAHLGEAQRAAPGCEPVARALATLGDIALVADGIADFLADPAAPREPAATGFSPAELVESAIAMIRDVVGEGGPELGRWIDASVPPRVLGDGHRLGQIVLTMLDDAANLAAGGTVTLRLGFAEGTPSMLQFRLLHEPAADDDGVRQPRDAGVIAQLRKIRAASLARLVALIGGAAVGPQRPDGLVHGFDVPAIAEAAPATGLDVEAGAARRILLIDDGAVTGQMLTLLLTEAGHQVCRVADVEASAFAGVGQDIALIDIGAGRDALAAARAFRAAHPAMPLLVLASGLSDQQGQAIEAAGAACVLAKPFSPPALAAALARSLPPSGAAAADCAVVDEAVHGALVRMLGPASVARLTLQLVDEVEALAAGEGASAEASAARLADLSSCAAMLGLGELAAACAGFGAVGFGRAGQARAGAAAAVGRVRSLLSERRLAA